MDLNVEHYAKESVEHIRSTSAMNLRETSAKSYEGKIRKLFIYLNDNEYDIRTIPDLSENSELINHINNFLEGKSDRTKKTYWSLMVSITRNKLCLEGKDTCAQYRAEFNKYKEIIETLEEQQAPKDKEKFLEDMTIDMLKKELKKKWMNGRMDVEGWVPITAGYIASIMCFRNEPATMMLSNQYLDKQEYPNTNFLWNKGRNKKFFIIRSNKVRDHNDPERVIQVPLELNAILNKYLGVHHCKWVVSNPNNTLKELGWTPEFFYNHKGYKKGFIGEPIPLLMMPTNPYSLTPMTEANYCQLIKRIWAPKWELTSTLIRKIYAGDVRTEHKGKLTEENKACEWLDHNKKVHDTNYILFFD